MFHKYAPDFSALMAIVFISLFAVPSLALVNITVVQAPAMKINNTAYNASVVFRPSGFANNTAYNATLGLSVQSFATETLGTILQMQLDFYSMQQQNQNQTLSVMVRNEFSALQSGAVVNGTIVRPDGTNATINFTEGASGNYTNIFLFDQIGNYTIGVTVAKSGFSNITSSKNIYAGLIEFASFTGVDVSQSTTAFFDLGLRNKGNVSSTVVPFLFIYNSGGTLVFNRQGLSSTVTAGQNVSLFQHNTLTWDVGSTAAGTYNATAYLRFSDTTNTTVQTQNRSFLFQVNAAPAAATGTTGTTGGGGGSVFIVNASQAGVNVPTAEFINFISIPILVETYQGRTVQQTIHMFNPLGVPIENVRIAVKGLPQEWFFIESADVVTLQPHDDGTFNIIFTIPQNAQPGTYQAQYSFGNGQYLRDFSFILRVNQIVPGQPTTVSKHAIVDELNDLTRFIISIRNLDTYLESLTVTEKIDKNVAEHVSEVEFSIPPTKVIQPDPIVQWTLSNLLPNEHRNITYRVKKTINTTKPFIYTSIEEIVSVERLSRIAPLTISIYDAALIVPILIIFVLVIVHRLRKSRTRESMSEARRLAERLRG